MSGRGRSGSGGLMPGEEGVQVDAADHQPEEDGLRDPAVGDPLGGVGDVDGVALGPAVEILDVRPLGTVGVLPGEVEAVPVLMELIELALLRRL
ncbi:hypothetical protein GCM10017776_13940 [Streptomyces griseoluteus]|nr:hypothetical protein GCM10017776_13940 [Streptomyces griseoluteus]